jgi:HEAT repeat protein
MNRRVVTVGVAIASGAIAMTAAATGPIHAPINLPAPQVTALSGIDVPLSGEAGKDLIESAFGDQPLEVLIEVARDADSDAGVRIRAYRAIGLYQTIEARIALTEDLEDMAQAAPGTEMLLLRAAIEALGGQREPDDVFTITPFLDFEPSRDIRAAAVEALRQIGSSTAIPALQIRKAVETTGQVRAAITRALRDLSQTE